MRKILKNKILLFLVLFAIGSTGVIAMNVLASNIEYDNSNSGLKDENNQDVDNVQAAIDALYIKANNNATGASNKNIVISKIETKASTSDENTIVINDNVNSISIDCVGVTNTSYPSHLEWNKTNGYSKSSYVSGAHGSEGNIIIEGNVLKFRIPYVVTSNPNTDSCTINIS